MTKTNVNNIFSLLNFMNFLIIYEIIVSKININVKYRFFILLIYIINIFIFVIIKFFLTNIKFSKIILSKSVKIH